MSAAEYDPERGNSQAVNRCVVILAFISKNDTKKGGRARRDACRKENDRLLAEYECEFALCVPV
ncbi:hypothetical protein DQG23_04285 [Paenibacillus contaminans]|uniref:Uncharacterized protein n=1 Tax=Paenibacillus contaminans TaxID=450362 RepID=A0A329MQG5_9BACL|nr:hypothetical protein DQG23_04285 [Paenibacillus contaminans]